MKRIITLLLIVLLLPCGALGECSPDALREKPENYSAQPVYKVPAEDASFEDCLMIGDSIVDVMANYGLIPPLDIEAIVGISPVHVHRSRMLTYGPNAEKMSLYQIAVLQQPKKLFVLAGTNAVGGKAAAEVLPEYHDLVDDLVRHLPDTEIYILSLPPVSVEAPKDGRKLTNQNIRDFNAGLLDLAKTHGIYYIDLYTPLLDETGTLGRRTYFASDHIHPTRAGVEVIFQTIRTHVHP